MRHQPGYILALRNFAGESSWFTGTLAGAALAGTALAGAARPARRRAIRERRAAVFIGGTPV
jgi:hypothetical protein